MNIGKQTEMGVRQNFAMAASAILALLWATPAWALHSQPFPETERNPLRDVRGRAENLRSRLEEQRRERETPLERPRETLRTQRDDELRQQRERQRTIREEQRALFRLRADEERRKAEERNRAAREEFRRRIAAMRDEHRKRTAVRVQEHINRSNALLTDHYLRYLGRLDTLLDRITARAETFQRARKRDTSAMRSAVGEAEKAVARARALVLMQKGKVYAPTVTSLEDLRENLRAVLEQMRGDHQRLREELRQVKETVHRVFLAFSASVTAPRQTP